MFPISTQVMQAPGLAQEPSAGQTLVMRRALRDEEVREEVKSGQGLEEMMKRRAKEMEKAIMKRAIKNAATNAGLQIAFNFVPVVGPAISAALGVINMIGAKRYEKKLKEHIAYKKKELEAFGNRKQRELNEALTNTYKQAYRDAVKLASSWQPLRMGEHSFQRDVINVQFAEGLDGLIDKITGRDTFVKARSQMDGLINDAKEKIRASVDPVIEKVRSPTFKAVLTKEIAMQLRQAPEFVAIAQEFGAPKPSTYKEEVKDPTSPAFDPEAAATGPSVNLTPVLLGGLAITGLLLFVR